MLMTVRSGAAVALLLAIAGYEQGPPALSQESLQAIVSGRVATGRSTGLIIGVRTPEGDTTVVSAGNERAGKPIDRDTLVEIGSITKVFTGILLAEMTGRGEVRLDQPVADLLTGVTVPARGARQITLGDLATQISALPRLPDNMKPVDPTNPYADYSVAQLEQFLARHELRRDPGSAYEYSNLGVGLLGHALSRRTGHSYEALVTERILAPLGMAHTLITLNDEARAHLADGHNPRGAIVPLWDLPTLAGAGGLRSTLADMLRFLAACQTPPASALGRAIGVSQTPRFTVNPTLALGLNWHISTHGGEHLLWHNGGTAGFRTMIGINVRTRVGAVLLGTSAQDNEDIVRHILVGTALGTP